MSQMMNSGRVCRGMEACHEQGRQHLVHGHDPVGQRAAAEAPVVGQHQGDLLGKAHHDAVHVHMGDAQLLATEALEEAVDKGEGAQIGAHPAVFPEALQAGDGSGGHHLAHGQQVIQPRAVVHQRVLHTAPLAVAGDAGLVLIAAAEAAGAVAGLPLGVEPLQLLVDGRAGGGQRIFDLLHFVSPFRAASIFLISRLSTNAWNRVRSCPAEPRVYSFSMVQQGMPRSALRIWLASTFS